MELISRVIRKMVEFDRGDTHRIEHFMKVYGYAKTIGELEKLDGKTQMILELSAAMHDIGIRICKEKYGKSDGELQQLEGPPAARKLLADFSLEQETVERVCYLVSRHHTYTGVEGMDYRILIEADLLVNLAEKKASAQQVEQARKQCFRTKAGTEILKCLFAGQQIE